MPKKDLDEKLALVRQKMRAENADAFLFVSSQNRFWLSGFMSTEGYLVVSPNESVLFVDGRYINAANKGAEVSQIRRLVSLNDVLEFLDEIKPKKMLVEGEYLTAGLYSTLAKKLPCELTTYESVRLRSAKTNQELVKIKESARLICEIANKLKKHLRPGMTELGISKWISTQILKVAQKDSFDPIVAAGINGANPHHHPTNKKLMVGEFVTCDLGCIYDEFCSDLTRTYVIGKPKNQRLINAYKTVWKSNHAGIALASSNTSGKQVHEECKRIIDETEFKGYFLHGTGHGVGLDIHEHPYVTSNNPNLLEVNAVVTIEPGIYLAGVGGMRIEDMIIIKKNGNEHITKLAQVLELK